MKFHLIRGGKPAQPLIVDHRIRTLHRQLREAISDAKPLLVEIIGRREALGLVYEEISIVLQDKDNPPGK